MPPEQWSDFPSTASFVQDVLAWTTALYTVIAQAAITLVAVEKSGRHTYLGAAARQLSWVTTNWDFVAYFSKIYIIIISDKDLHNLRLFGSALESSKSHRSIYYFKIYNLHKLFWKAYKIIIPYKEPHNLRLLENALESSKPHRTIYYFKMYNLHKLFWKTYKIVIPYKDPHNLRLLENALESSKSHRTIYYFKIYNLHKLFLKNLQNYNSI